MRQQGNAEPMCSAVPKPVVPAKRCHPSEDQEETTPLPSAQAQSEVIDLTADSDEESGPAALHAQPDGDTSVTVSVNKARRQPDRLSTQRPIGHHSVVKLAPSSRPRPQSLLNPKVQTEPVVPRADPSATNIRPSIATLAMPRPAIPLGPYISLDSHASYAGARDRPTALKSPMPTARLHDDGFHQLFPAPPQPRHIPYTGPIHHSRAQGTILGSRPAIPALPASFSAAPASSMSNPQPLKFISHQPIVATTTITAGPSPRMAQSLLQDERQRTDRLEKEFAAQKVTSTHLEDRLAKLNLKHRDIVRERDDYRTKWEAVKQHNVVLKQDNLTLVARCQELENEAGDLDTIAEDQRMAIHLAEEGLRRAPSKTCGFTPPKRSDCENVPDPVAEIVDRGLAGMISVTTFILSRDNEYMKQPPFVVPTLDVPTKRALATLVRSKFGRLMELEGLEQKCFWTIHVGGAGSTGVWSKVEADRFELWRNIVRIRGEWRNWESRQAGTAPLNSRTGSPGERPDGFALVVLAHITKADDVERDISEGRF